MIDRRRIGSGLAMSACLACLSGVLASGLPGGSTGVERDDPTPFGESRDQAPSEPEVSIHLPFALLGRLPAALQTAAAAGSATARAATRTPTASPSPTDGTATPPTVATTPVATGTVTPSASPSTVAATATPTATSTSLGATATPSASPTPTGPTPTASATRPATASPTPRKDPAGERLVPRAVARSGTSGVTFDPVAETYRLRHSGAFTVVYEIDLRHPDNSRGRLTIRERESGRFPMAGAGLYYRRPDGALVEPRLFSLVGTVTAVEHARTPEGDGVVITVGETLEDRPHRKRYTVRLVGAALEVRAASLDGVVAADDGGYAGFTAGDVEGSQDGVSVRLPYMDAVPVTMLDHRWFASTLVDVPRSRATTLLPRGPEGVPGAFTNETSALYLPDAAGRIRTVDEHVWVVLSPDVGDTFPVPEHPPSPHRAGLAPFVHVTLAGRAPDVGFADDRAYVERLRDWRVTDVVFHKPAWEDAAVRRPAHGPPDPAAGGAGAFDELVAATGGRLAPTLAYTLTETGCPGEPNPAYAPADRVTGADGSPKAAGAVACAAGGTSTRFLLAPRAAGRRSGAFASALALDHGVRAVDLADLSTWNPAFPWPGAPDNVLDLAAMAGDAGTVGEAVAAYKRVLADLQGRVGPVFGPGAFGTWERGYDSYYAGYVDGVARSLSSGSLDASAPAAYLVAPDYELTVVRPRMVGYGMGDYSRFFPDMAPDAAGPLSTAHLDRWQAGVLAFGHAGAWTANGADGAGHLAPAEQVKHYVIQRALQPRYLGAQDASVGYVDADGVRRDLSWALAHDFDLSGPRLHVAYDDELDLWINHGRGVWTVTVGGTAYLLPEHGWVARGDGGLLGYSALVEGHRADYLQAPDVLLLDGRGQATNFGGPVARDLVVRFADGRRLEEQPDGSLRWAGP